MHLKTYKYIPSIVLDILILKRICYLSEILIKLGVRYFIRQPYLQGLADHARNLFSDQEDRSREQHDPGRVMRSAGHRAGADGVGPGWGRRGEAAAVSRRDPPWVAEACIRKLLTASSAPGTRNHWRRNLPVSAVFLHQLFGREVARCHRAERGCRMGGGW